MNEIYFVDSTLRDGHQSLWATRMTAPMMLSIAPIMDRAGFKCCEVGAAGNHFVAYMRYLRENPWEKPPGRYTPAHRPPALDPEPSS